MYGWFLSLAGQPSRNGSTACTTSGFGIFRHMLLTARYSFHRLRHRSKRMSQDSLHNLRAIQINHHPNHHRASIDIQHVWLRQHHEVCEDRVWHFWHCLFYYSSACWTPLRVLLLMYLRQTPHVYKKCRSFDNCAALAEEYRNCQRCPSRIWWYHFIALLLSNSTNLKTMTTGVSAQNSSVSTLRSCQERWDRQKWRLRHQGCSWCEY